MCDSVLPTGRLLALDERLEHAAAKPVIMPETIVCDHGKRRTCRRTSAAVPQAGHQRPATHPRGPAPTSRTSSGLLQSVATLFAQFVSGYVGRSAELRGRKAEG